MHPKQEFLMHPKQDDSHLKIKFAFNSYLKMIRKAKVHTDNIINKNRLNVIAKGPCFQMQFFLCVAFKTSVFLFFSNTS